MATSAQQLNRFFRACEELMNERYIMADARIEEILRSIAESRALTDLFSALTERFDYPSAKKTYLRFPASNGSAHGKVFLPKDRGEVLAFIFCLLVDIDAGRIKFDDFLLRYFYEDGSYTASFALFVDRMIRPFRDIVRESFPDVTGEDREKAAKRRNQRVVSLDKFASLADGERSRLKTVSLSSVDSLAGDMLLSEIIKAAERNDASLVKALVAGYRYFLHALFLEGGEELIKEARKLEYGAL